MWSGSNAIVLLVLVLFSWPDASFAVEGVTGRFDSASQRCLLESRWLKPGETVKFRLRAVCRFDEKSAAWQRLPEIQPVKSHLKTPHGVRVSSALDLANFKGAEPPALLAFMWTENGVRHSKMLACGEVLCNDISLPQAPIGQLPSCVPGAKTARAQFVPDFQSCLNSPE